MDVRDLAAVESPCPVVVDEDLDEVEVNAPPRLHEGSRHAEQIARRQSVMVSKISKIYA